MLSDPLLLSRLQFVWVIAWHILYCPPLLSAWPRTSRCSKASTSRRGAKCISDRQCEKTSPHSMSCITALDAGTDEK
jgi:hypothetical protein